MRISHRYRFIFFSFPKTGSESVREAIAPYSDMMSKAYDHIRPEDLRSICLENGWPFDEYYRFMFVRNPWTRLVSVFRMIQRHFEGFDASFGQWLLSSRPDGIGGGGFLSKPPADWIRYGTYTVGAFANDKDGNRLVDDLFRLEDIGRVPKQLQRRGIPVEQIGFVNRAGAVNLEEYYPPALRAVVAMRYAKEIEEFGYVFPG